MHVSAITSVKSDYQAFADATDKASGLLVSGLAVRILFGSQMGWPLLAQGIGIFAIRLAVNLNRLYAFVPLRDVELAQTAVQELLQSYPNLRVITFLFALALAWLGLPGSMVIGFGLGGLGALMLERDPQDQYMRALL